MKLRPFVFLLASALVGLVLGIGWFFSRPRQAGSSPSAAADAGAPASPAAESPAPKGTPPSEPSALGRSPLGPPVHEGDGPVPVVPRADRSGELVRLALDGSAGSEARLAALRELAGIPGRTAVEALVGVARTLAGQDESGELALEAAALIAGADTPEAVELLSEILTDSHPGFGVFDDLPVLVQDAVRGSLRKNPDEMLVAKSLGQRFSATADPLAQSRVEMLEHPALMARLAEEARAAGDIPLMEERLALLETTRDARVFDSVVRLAEAGNVSRATLDELIYNWALRQPESVGVEQLMERLGSAAATDTSRALAAIGLAGYSEANPGYLAQLREALSKALGSGSLSPSLAQSFRGTMDLLDATR